jgi:hypothetical protein
MYSAVFIWYKLIKPNFYTYIDKYNIKPNFYTYIDKDNIRPSVLLTDMNCSFMFWLSLAVVMSVQITLNAIDTT